MNYSDYFDRGFSDICKAYKVDINLIKSSVNKVKGAAKGTLNKLSFIDNKEQPQYNSSYEDIPNVGFKNPGNSTELGKKLNVKKQDVYKPRIKQNY
jgi:hypothetical protein